MINFRVDNKIALVTGCSRGIGKTIAIELANAGADIIGVSNSLVAKDSDIAKAIEATGKKFYPYAADFSDRDSLYNFLNKVKTDHPQIDILINNAGHILRKPVANHPDDYWDKIIAINLNAQFIITREIGKRMVERKAGKIVFTCSLLSFQGGINVPGYAASKGAIASLLKSFANEWAPHGITVNGVAPGYIDTDNTAQLQADPERSAAILSRIPAGRWGKTSDLAGAFIFLSSPASDYINGSIITVDGGWMGR
ncbi:MAG TPA: SDR family oxidoreductase [Chitinophagaceae bacterium]|nr:SDR family oxidoreductase [Chitinophagaceae bacterium]HQX72665.1 SDR family oxidoreductase [Chitinophagaceae bacterium]HQZ74769.1 SDR family oxidoreductase [Chitinophagaceae bacterium]